MASLSIDERTSLLPVSQSSSEVEPACSSLLQELQTITKKTIPICVSFAPQNIVQACSVVIAGTLGPSPMAIASYGFMFFSCTSTIVAIRGATALDTLCGQALTSVHNPSILGLFLQQCIIILLFIFGMLITPIWLLSGRLFIALGQEEQFGLGTGRFMCMMLPAGFLQVLSECLKKFLQAQETSNRVGVVMFGTSAAGILISFALVKWTDLGLWAIPLAFSIYQLSTAILLLYTIYVTPIARESFRASTTGVLGGLPRVLYYAITGILTIATEWWSFEILAMMAARLDKVSIGAQSILMSSDLFLTTISLGISVAASHRIDGLLGANRGSLAPKAITASYLLSFIFGVLEFAAIMLARSQYGYLFTSSPSVVQKTAQVLPLMAAFQVLDLSNGGAGGVLRGAGKNHLSGACNFVAYYGVGLTTGYYLCFQRDYGLFGLWAGIIAGSGALLMLQTACITRISWDELGREVSKRHRQ
ncbi:MATE efflux family protein [Mytilinidion resinicola]|uniref:MATE efflux family protein n=1 Tax=Mytilinidion resinicola TaxID=574789 RepID=A0A6A6YAE7_9PEZI|nr:MATE efflux family protein [Mytilinidion resinicola]KAF2804797.1 MATE efflux family protein [Mytilinidion resinicola]